MSVVQHQCSVGSILSIFSRVQVLSRLVSQVTRSQNTASLTSKYSYNLNLQHLNKWDFSVLYLYCAFLIIFDHLLSLLSPCMNRRKNSQKFGVIIHTYPFSKDEALGANFGFKLLIKDTLTCSIQGPGIEPITFLSLEPELYQRLVGLADGSLA